MCSATFGLSVETTEFPPFHDASDGATTTRPLTRARRPGDPGCGRSSWTGPDLGTPPEDSGRWHLRVPALVGPPPFRPDRPPGRLSRLADGARHERLAEPARTEMARQGAAQSHQRFQLR